MLAYSIDNCKLDVSKYNIAINVQFCRKDDESLDHKLCLDIGFWLL